MQFIYIILVCLFAAIRSSHVYSMFYVYEWPEKLTNSWPSSVSSNNKEFSMEFYSNFGAGPLINESKGLYKTFQYGITCLILFAPYLS